MALGVAVALGFGVIVGAFCPLGVAEGVEMEITEGTGVL